MVHPTQARQATKRYGVQRPPGSDHPFPIETELRSLSNLRRPRISTRSAAAIGLLALVAVLSFVALSGLTTSSPPPTVVASDPDLTVSSTAWSLDELLHRADAGAVAAIGTMTPRPDPLSRTSGAPILVARTRDGALEPIRLQVGLADAVEVVRAAGFGRLLTDEAIQVAASDGGPRRCASRFSSACAGGGERPPAAGPCSSGAGACCCCRQPRMSSAAARGSERSCSPAT